LQQHELLLRFPPLAHIPEVHRQAFDERTGPHFEPLAQARIEIFKFNLAAGGNGALEFLAQALIFIVDQNLPNFLAKQLGRGVAQQLLAFLVQVGKATLRIEGNKGLRAAAQGGGQPDSQLK